MSDYERKTEECNWTDLHPALRSAIETHAQENNIGNLVRDLLICCRTTNKRLKKTRLLDRLAGGDPDKEHITAVLITPDWFIYGRIGEKQGILVTSARLRDVAMQRYTDTEQFRLLPDNGLEVMGLFTGRLERQQIFIGFEPGRPFEDVLTLLSQL